MQGSGTSLAISGGTLVGASSTTAAGGSVVIDGQTLTYVPPSNLVGEDTLTYMVTDDNGVSTVNSITVSVAPASDRKPGLRLQADRSAALTFAASPGQTYWVEWSDDFVTWFNISTVTADPYTGLVTFTAPASSAGEIFYRLSRAPAAPTPDE